MAVQILGSYWTLAVGAGPEQNEYCPHDFRVRVETAAKAGFTAMGFWHSDLAEVRRKYSFKEMRQILDANGIRTIEVEWLLDWFATGERRANSDATRKLLLDAAEALTAHHIKIGDLGNDCAEIPKMTEEFALLCRQAAERGTNVLFEMLPADFSRVPSLDKMLAIVRGSGAKNGGIMLDNLHMERTGTSPDDIRSKLTPTDLIGVEINDGFLARPRKFIDSVINKRLLPGDGEFDIASFLQAAWSLGYDGPVGVEVINEYMRLWDLETAARETMRKARAVVDAARAKFDAARR